MLKKTLAVLLTTFGLILGVSAQENPLVVMTHDSFNVDETLLNEFRFEYGVMVEIVYAGDTGQLVNQAVLSKDAPVADVLYGIDNTFLSRALENDIFVPYESPELVNIDPQFLLDHETRVTPIDFGDVCLNYDIAYFTDQQLDLPTTFDDLLKPEYKGLLVAMNPATSSPGLAFMLATVAYYGTEGDYTYLDYWQDLVENDVLIVDDWDSGYFGNFSGASDGDYPLVVSYASSTPFSVDEKTGEATTASIVADGMCFRQIEYAGVLKNGNNPSMAQRFIDFLVSKAFQEDMPNQMYVFPVRKDAELPELFAKFATIPAKTAELSFDDIATKRDEWIQAWTETVLR